MTSWRVLFGLCVAAWLAVGQTCAAHFVWIVPQEGKVQIYFSEAAEPDDPALLSRIAKAQLWARTNDRRAKEPFQALPLTLENNTLSAISPASAAVYGLSHDYGVLSRGEAMFRLRYYAKAYGSPLPGEWIAVGQADRLPLELTPEWQGPTLVLTATWQGRPAKGLAVRVDGCGLDAFEAITDDAGRVICEPTAKGWLSARVRHVDATPGEVDGKPFPETRSYSTLSLAIEPPAVKAVAHALPALEKGMTSFGGAVAGDYLYVYGGHYGGAHHYSQEEQSGDFRRISLTAANPQWEDLPGGPKLTGLALVAHNGKLYRIGGFTAKNAEDAEQSLWSQDGFAMYDPATKTWTDLPKLPEPRSSHDAAVLDGKLYVVGGWNLAGNAETQWHDTAWVCDLNRPDLKWDPIATPPFHRRALSLAAHNGKLYVLGGMQEQGGPSTRCDVYDPALNAWSQGPSLIGNGMEGFGNSSFAINGQLLASTMSGSVQRLSANGQQWELAGQLAHPRFFHRLLPTASGQVVIVGGASMTTGKTNDLELLSLRK
uniref:N-acetylneuraminate epimerase n=1 Tax=Schlesneria paludicola TaxID=360056 RepID=A0A7C2JZL8_9PLAN